MDKSNYKVLFLYPNERHMSMIPPSIALLSALAKRENFSVDLFDTSLYPKEGLDSDEIREQNLSVHLVPDTDKVQLKQTDKFKDFQEKVATFKPDMIAVTATDSMVLLMLELLRSVKQFDFLTVLGGPFASWAPDVAINYPEIDVICVQEGENAFIKMCRRLKHKKDISDNPNLWIKKQDG